MVWIWYSHHHLINEPKLSETMKKKLQLLKKETYEVTYPLDRNNNSLRGHEISWSNYSTFPMLVMPPSRLSIWRNQRAHTDDQHHSPIATWLHQQQPRTRGKGAKGQQNTVFTPNMDVSQSRLVLKSIGLILKWRTTILTDPGLSRRWPNKYQ